MTNCLSSDPSCGCLDGGAEWNLNGGRERREGVESRCGLPPSFSSHTSGPDALQYNKTSAALHASPLSEYPVHFNPAPISIPARRHLLLPIRRPTSITSPKNQNKSITRAKVNAHFLRIRRSFRLPPLFMIERGCGGRCPLFRVPTIGIGA